LEEAEAGAKKQLKNSKNLQQTGRFPAATEWELIYSDSVILLGLTYALRYAFASFPCRTPLTSTPIWYTYPTLMTANPITAICSVCEYRCVLIVAHQTNTVLFFYRYALNKYAVPMHHFPIRAHANTPPHKRTLSLRKVCFSIQPCLLSLNALL